MSGTKEKTKEIKKPAGEAKASGQPGGQPGGHNGPANHAQPSTQSSKPSAVGTKVGCLAVGCKDKDVRASYCEEHFKQFKFGLITKTGQKVFDYEKKLEHYQKWLKAQKVA